MFHVSQYFMATKKVNLQGRILLFKEVSKTFIKVSTAIADNQEKSVFKIIDEQMDSISIVFTFCLLESWLPDKSEYTTLFTVKLNI